MGDERSWPGCYLVSGPQCPARVKQCCRIVTISFSKSHKQICRRKSPRARASCPGRGQAGRGEKDPLRTSTKKCPYFRHYERLTKDPKIDPGIFIPRKRHYERSKISTWLFKKKKPEPLDSGLSFTEVVYLTLCNAPHYEKLVISTWLSVKG